MSCILPNKTAEANAKGWLRAKGVLDKYLNILDLPKFRKLNNQLTEHGIKEYNIDGRWFYEEGDGRKAVPNSALFKEVDKFNNTNTTELYNISDNTVDANLKVIGALQNPKVIPLYNRFYTKGNKDKFYSELTQFTGKQQVDLLREYNETNNPQSLDDMITGITSELSYTVEINTAKTNRDIEDTPTAITVYRNFEFKGEQFTKNDEIDFDGEYKEVYRRNGKQIKRAEFIEFAKKAEKVREAKPTSYYFNLTVPGGINYTENEIATPAITPAIKGHAQFSTDNGIGWFRSDDKTEESSLSEGFFGEYAEDNLMLEYDNLIEQGLSISFKEFKQEYLKQNSGSLTKTRRILEVQSDLFQKGRDLDDLVTRQTKGSLDTFSTKMSELNRKLDRDEITLEEYRKERQILEDKQKLGEKFRNTSENKFLQLLNKNNNWVTFFVKSIIQDSAKKGYEKVLFPSGDTASKVEGHTTLEEFKKQKEDRIKELERRLENKQNELSTSKNLLESDKRILQREIEKIPTEINQLKQELKRVETEGFGALRPIHAFYEITVQNILNKQYGKNNIERVKDEFGNEWFELTLNESRDKATIYFSKPLDNSKKQLAEKNQKLEQIVLRFLNKAGVKVETVDNLKTRKGLDADGLADITNQLIKISKDASTGVLSEEAAHFLVEMLGENHPLIRQMMDIIESTSIFSDVMSSSYVKEYNNDIELLKKEAVGKLISQYVSSNYQNNNSEQKGIFDKLVSLIKKVLKVLSNKFSSVDQKQFEAEVFGKAANMILTGDVSSLSKPTSGISLYNISGGSYVVSKGFPMQVSNLEKMEFGQKRFTIRPRYYKEGVYKFGDTFYEITLPRKEKSKITDFKDADFIKKTSIGRDDEIKQEHIRDFYEGKTSMYVYQIKKLDSNVQMIYQEQNANKDILTGSKSIDTYIERALQSIANLERQKTVGDTAKRQELEDKIAGLKRYIKKLTTTKDLAVVEDRAKKELDKLKKRLVDFDSMTPKEMEEFSSIALEHLTGWSDIATIIDYGDDESNAVINRISGDADRLLNELDIKIKTVWLPEIFANNKAVTLEEVLANPTDTGRLEAMTLDVNTSKIPIVRKIGELLDRASHYAYQLSKDSIEETNEQDKKLKDYAKRVGLSDKALWDMFQQKDSSGKNTGYYIHEISAEYYSTLFSKLNAAKKGDLSWKEYYDWLNKNTNSSFNKEKYERAKEQAKMDLIDENGNIDIAEYNNWIAEHEENRGKKRYMFTDHTPKIEIWKDKRFDKILNTPELKEYYDYFVSTLEERTKRLPVGDRQSKYYIPELKKGTVMDLSKIGITSVFKGMGESFLNNFTSDPIGSSTFERRDPRTGQLIRTIPVYMMSNNLTGEQKDIDLSKVLKAFTVMSIAHEQKVVVEEPIRMLKNVFKTLKERDADNSKDMFGRVVEVLNANKGTIDQLEYAVDSVLYGAHKALPKAKVKLTVMGKTKEVSAEGTLDKLISYTRMKGMALNPFSAVTNLLYGLTSNIMYSSGNQEFSESQALKALSIVMNPMNKAKVDAILREYNVMEDVTDTFYESGGKLKQNVNKVLYKFQTETERLNYAMTTVAVMLNTDVNGKNLWESYKLDNSKKLVIDSDEYHSLSEKKYKLHAKIKEVNKIIHGNYEQTSPMLINKTAWGRALMVFRRWLPMMIHDRFGSERYNDRLERTTKGRYRSYISLYKSGKSKALVGTLIKELISQISFRAYNNDMSNVLDNETDIANIRRNVAELKFILAFSILTLLLKGIEVPDDDEEYQTAMKFLINQSMRIETDLTFFFKPNEFIKIAGNISPVITTLKNMQDVVHASYELVFGEDIIQSGPNAGRSRFMREMTQAIPAASQAQRLLELKNLNLDSPYTR